VFGRNCTSNRPRKVWQFVKNSVVSLGAVPVMTRVMYQLEQVVAHALVPFALLLMLLRARKEPDHMQSVSDRFGLGVVKHKGAVWVYAASLGETRAASPLVRRLRAAGYKVLLTHQSPAGRAEGKRLFGHDTGVAQAFIPLDLFWAIRIFLRRYKPVALIVMEIEIWPAMLLETTRKGIPTIMANGNLLDRSIDKNRGLRSHLLQLYKLFSRIFTRADDYRDRYVSLGVDAARVSVVGEMKFDQLTDPAHGQMARTLRANLAGAQRVLMIASSVEAEEAMLLPMVARLIAQDAGLRVLWAPRSPQRFQAVADAVSGLGLTVAQRSKLGAAMDGDIGTAQVLIGDSIGEMDAYYPVADLVFVGASLVDHGGHNIVEPLALGRPVVMGPSTYGIDFAAKPAARLGTFQSLPDSAQLEQHIVDLFADPPSLARMSAAALEFTAEKSGAADATCRGIVAILAPPIEGAPL
jgi:3-deoxy-D-manno-octulosonic-acid transferase